MADLINERDLSFQLYEVLDTESLLQRDTFADHDRATFDAVLDTARRVAQEYFAPHNRKGDIQEPTLIDGKVHIIPEVKQAVDAFIEAGFLTAHHPAELGGIQLPITVHQACFTYFLSANVATIAYPFLTMAAGNLLAAFASPEQKERFLAHMLTGRFAGTMALTEPQAGSSLSDITTTAEPNEDGSYSIVGSKIFISGGVHDLSENIIHLVLARIKGAPAGIKGISLFIVPAVNVNDDGSLGDANDVALTGLLHKMGYRGTTSTILAFGESGNCRGYLVGEPHKGLKYMFHMMNEARIGVGVGATMLGYAGYLYALDYARTRPQGRHLSNKDPHQDQVPLIEHADVKRMLLAQKAYVEGCLSLCLYCSRLVDDHRTAPDEKTRREAATLLDLLTPITKAWSSDYCIKANDLALQILGGYGYTREYPVEQYLRDNRLNPIHEGANGIQALDLLGRKVPANGGAAVQLLAARVQETIMAAGAIPQIAPLAQALADAGGLIAGVTAKLGGAFAEHPPERVLANASVYLDMMGRVVIAWMWLRQAVIAAKALEQAESADIPFYQGKLQTARYFLKWELPQIKAQAELLKSLDPTCLDMRDDWF